MNTLMTEDEAIEALRFHCGADERIDDPRWSNGFLGMLRPYQGLIERNFHEVMAAIVVLQRPLQRQDVPRVVISALWGICHYARSWGLDDGGMLRRNNLITPEEIQTLDVWVNMIEDVLTTLLDSEEPLRLRDFGYDPPAEWARYWGRIP